MYTDLFVTLASSAIVKELLSFSSDHQPEGKGNNVYCKRWSLDNKIQKEIDEVWTKRNTLQQIGNYHICFGILDHSLSAENVHKPACNHFKFHSFNTNLKMAIIKCESLTFYIMQFQLVASFYSSVGNEGFRYHDADVMKVYFFWLGGG